MSSILLAAPAAEPLTLGETKAFLRVEHNDDDAVIAALIAAARIHLEMQTRRALITQTWRLIHDNWPQDGRLRVSPSPLQQVVAARVYDESGATFAIDTQAFVADKAASPALIAFAPWSMPAPGHAAGGIEIDVRVGYGDAPASVPEPLRQAIRLLVTHWYENRGADGAKEPPAGVQSLLAPFRAVSL